MRSHVRKRELDDKDEGLSASFDVRSARGGNELVLLALRRSVCFRHIDAGGNVGFVL